MTSEPERLGDALDEVGRRLGMGSPTEVGKVWAHWREIVGPSIADHADPTSLRGGVLRVRADSPPWATEIGYLTGEIQARINAAVGNDLVSEVRVWIGPRTERPRPRPPGAVARSRKDAGDPVVDPEVALERARKAWARKVREGSERGPRNPVENPEKPR